MLAMAVLGYGLASAAFLFLCLASLWPWRRRQHAGMLSLAACASAAYFALAGPAALWQASHPLLLEELELMHSAAWAALLLRFLNGRSTWRHAANHALASWTGGLVLGLALVTLAFHFAPPDFAAAYSMAIKAGGRVILAVTGMMLVEQLYRSAGTDGRWTIKHACFGIGALFAYDFYLYSNATLFRQVDVTLWTARAFIDALAVPLIALSFFRRPNWLAGVAISRRMAFSSTTILGAACYMLVMATAGYYIRLAGSDWGPVIQAVFLAGAILLLLAILSSGTARAWLRVFIAKHFYHYSFDYRVEWLQFTRALSQDGPALPERIIQSIAALVESPGGALWLGGQHGFRQAAAWNFPSVSCEEPADSAFCAFLQKHQWILDLDQPDAAPRGESAPALPEWTRSYPAARIVVPLTMRNRLVGFVILMRPRSQLALNWEVFDLLRVAASQAASYLAEQQATEALIVARQFESFNRMSTFVVHDIKNIVSQLSMMVTNAERHGDNPEFQAELMQTLNHSVQKMKFLLQRLHRAQAADHAVAVPLDGLARKAVAEKAGFEPQPTLKVLQEGMAVLADPVILSRVVGHLLQNAIEATPRSGRVCLTLKRADRHAVIEVADSGHGMSERFIRERLFKPFSTTKPNGMGVGVFESRSYVQDLGGTMDVDSHQEHGTTFTIRLPLHNSEGEQFGNVA